MVPWWTFEWMRKDKHNWENKGSIAFEATIMANSLPTSTKGGGGEGCPTEHYLLGHNPSPLLNNGSNNNGWLWTLSHSITLREQMHYELSWVAAIMSVCWGGLSTIPFTIILKYICSFHCILLTSVVRAVGPSVNTLSTQLIFPSKPNFCNLFEFLATKSTQKSMSSTH
jgi:hypothetical protein